LNQEYYDIELTEGYISTFKEIVKKTFKQQVNRKGVVELKFNRIFLVAIKD
jgi:trans-aconitate methyltransferase